MAIKAIPSKTEEPLDVNQVRAEWENDPRIKNILERLPKLTEDAKSGKLDGREIEMLNGTLEAALEDADESLAAKIFVVQRMLRLICIPGIPQAAGSEKREGNVGILQEYLQKGQWLEGNPTPQHILDLSKDPDCVSHFTNQIFGFPGPLNRSILEGSDSSEDSEDLFSPEALVKDVQRAENIVNKIALEAKGYSWIIHKGNYPAARKELKELKEFLLETIDLMGSNLPKELAEKADQALGEIKLARKICGQLKYNSRDPDPRLEKVFQKVESGTVNPRKLKAYAHVVSISLERNPDQKIKDLGASIQVLLDEEAKKKALGEIRFVREVPPFSKIFVCGDEKSGLKNWALEKAKPLDYDAVNNQWVFKRLSSEGEYKFVLDNVRWEIFAGNRDLSKLEITPPYFFNS